MTCICVYIVHSHSASIAGEIYNFSLAGFFKLIFQTNFANSMYGEENKTLIVPDCPGQNKVK